MNLKKDQEDRLNRISTLDALLNRLTLFSLSVYPILLLEMKFFMHYT